MVKLTVTVGLPGAGKSDYAKMLHNETRAHLIQVGNIRRETKKANPDATERDVFDETYRQVCDCLSYGYDCILDGSFFRANQRKHLFFAINKIMPGIPYEKVCVIIATPIEVVFYNNMNKRNHLSEEIISEQFRSWQTPAYWEGWDEIWAYYADSRWIGIRGRYGEFAETHTAFDLNDKDSFDSLGGHCNSVHNHLLRLLQTRDPKGKDELREKSLLAASLIHDCGKPIVETREEGKSLYYNHSNVGAYEALFYKIDTGADSIYVSDLVNYHMDPYEWEKADSARAYAVKDYGGEFVEDLSLLHQADEMAKGKR